MSRISFCALGGLGENGKNMYVVEVDGRIFILDAGLKNPSFDLYGIDAVIPDITHLLEQKDRIQGIF
ncbi:MAG TPA: ribonuclease J, partial [Acholeplasmataceae bacterium]|nr:ribonuclease J [Acholeplasmataceae bacterium]